MAARQYNWNTTPQIYSADTDPLITSDAATIAAKVGDVWINTATGNIFDSVSVAAGAAIWRPRPRTWASGAAVSGAADTNENTLATIAIPAGAMGINGVLRVTTLWTMTSSANNKIVRTKLGSTDYGAATLTTTVAYREQRQINNRAGAASQVAFTQANGASWSTAAGANMTGTENTANALNLLITGQKATAGETLTLESYLVELLRPDIGPT